VTHTHTHTHTHTAQLTHAHWALAPCTLNAVGLLSSDVETRGLPPLAPPPRVCGEVCLTLPYLVERGQRRCLRRRSRTAFSRTGIPTLSKADRTTCESC